MIRKYLFLIFTILALCGCKNSNNNVEIQEEELVAAGDSYSLENESLTDNLFMSKESDIEEGGALDESETTTPTEEEGTEFVFWDKKGIEQSMPIDFNIEMHSYNWEGLISEGEYKYYYENDQLKSQVGIDVSEYQGEIDWNLVKSEGIDFVFVRLGYRGYGESGSLNIDSKFEENISGALEAGLEVGVYFFSQAVSEEEAVEEAVFILEHIEFYDISYPIAYDLEFIENSRARTDGLTKNQLTANCSSFCRKIENYGYAPLIYTDMLREASILDLKALSDYAIWYSDYEDIPQTPYQFEFWQFTEKGRVNGISGYVDINIRITE